MSAQARPRSREAATGRWRAVLTSIVLPVLTVAPIPVLAALAAWPIYDTPTLWLVTGIAALAASATVWLGVRLRWGGMTLVALALGFLALLLPLGVPGALAGGPSGWLRGLGDGVAAVALGWKQLLTLALPVGSYQTVLVPVVTVVFVAAAAATALVLRGGRWAPAAGALYLLPVLFGTAFGSSTVSAPLRLGGITVTAPRELALWLAAAAAAVAWIAWSSGRARRQALTRGRKADAALAAGAAAGAASGVLGHGAAAARPGTGRRAVRRNAAVRGVVAAVTVAAALAAALIVAPLVTTGVRTVPRDAIDPELVVQDRVSPLAAYRAWKRDDTLQAELFSVTAAGGQLPERLTLAVLPEYDGVDFTVGQGAAAGRFQRFPSGGEIADPVRVGVEILGGYADVWVPLAAPLGEPPSFTGSRAGWLEDSFYLNRATGSAVAVPTAQGLAAGDGYLVEMSAASPATVDSRPASDQPLVDTETLTELARWLKLQQLPNTGEGLTTAIDRLRERGYLSHSLTDGAGEGLWLRDLGEAQGLRFVASAGGHSWSRVEQLFGQLTAQQLAAGDDSTQAMLVAGIGDDEQFAAAAAVLARAMGFDSRVVVGVRLGGPDDGVPGVPACASVCRGEHVAAWVEVAGADGVWAPVDVSPQIAVPPTMLQKGEQLPEFPTQPEDRDASESDPPVGMSDQERGTDGEHDATGLSALWPVLKLIGLALLGVLLLAVLALFVPLVKWLRRRARRSQQLPELRALAAWDELLDSYRDGGARVPGGSRTDTMRQLGVEGGEWIAWTVDQAVFARESITDETADTLWEIVDARTAAQWDDRSVWQRLRARFSFASFGRVTWARMRDVLRLSRQRETTK